MGAGLGRASPRIKLVAARCACQRQAMGDRVRPIVDLKTTCACGAVSVEVHGRVYSMFLCSCEDCQKATGTGHSAIAIVDPGEVTVSGETRSFARQAASGATF